MRLSIELLDHILSFLQSDRVSLQACYESHAVLSQLAERYQFTRVVLDDFRVVIRQSAFRSSEFTEIIHRRPHIAMYVHSIEMSTEYSPALSSVLPMMTLLKKVELHGNFMGRWLEIPEHFRQAFLDCIHLSSMEDVYISHHSDLPLSAMNHVKRLNLCEWRDDEYFPDTTNLKLDDKFQLEYLSLTGFTRASLHKVIAWVQPTCTLRSLDICGIPYELLASLLDNCSNSLTDLQLDLVSLFHSFSTFIGDERLSDSLGDNFPFTLSTLSHLERVTIRAEVDLGGTRGLYDVERQFHSPIPAIEQAMKTVSSRTLEFLKLEFFFTVATCRPLPHAQVLWSSLVHLVAESPFPCIKLHITVDPDIILNSLAESAELMRYVKQGVLVITPELPVTNKQDTPAVEKTSTDQVHRPI